MLENLPPTQGYRKYSSFPRATKVCPRIEHGQPGRAFHAVAAARSLTDSAFMHYYSNAMMLVSACGHLSTLRERLVLLASCSPSPKDKSPLQTTDGAGWNGGHSPLGLFFEKS
jgi:hypothetical protein